MSRDDWEKLGAIAAVVGGLVVLHGITNKRWSQVHTAATVVSVVAAISPYL